ncbi:MotA/TolQ/ExbB proton channel family protein [Psychromonas sp. PT13]|uniref:MotA/TolQ/ExbB proton channel family protein n=1 Tax=Psychromonas sp. PT13 TaxID=3439547 RepID=UPI003EB7C03D
MNRYLIPILLCSLVTFTSHAETNLLQTTQQAKKQQQSSEQQRVAEFKAIEAKNRAIRDKLLAEKEALQTSIDQLSAQFADNELQLSEKDKALHLASGSLGELFGVVRQVAKSFYNEQSDRVTSIGQTTEIKAISAIIDAKTLPSREQLYTLWQAFMNHIDSSGKIVKIDVPYITENGTKETKQVTRLGGFGLIDDRGYLNWSSKENIASHYLVQPEPAPSATQLDNNSLIAIDPSNGTLLEQLALTPTLFERFEQGGVIGKVILGFLIIGLLLGLCQGGFLFYNKLKINAQLKHKERIGNNPLGRILGVYKYDKSPNVEALELRLYEIVLDEQQKLERGLSMLKLLAALSPMLGLLGTVTGMIETFQVITQYGNADPKLMAESISTALVTTVLGLIAAMPLLFLYNILNALADNVRTLLEKQGLGLVAQRAEENNGSGESCLA